jgi:hemolysin activation/secretion protein
MLLINDLPGIDVKAVLTPSKTVPGSADLTLVANRKIADAYLSYDNYGTRYIGPLETSAGISVNSLLAPGDSNAAHFTISSIPEELQFAEFVHTQPIGNKGLNFTLGSNYTATRAGFLLDPFDIKGYSFSVYSNLVYPLIRARTHNLLIRGVANYQNVTSLILSSPFYQDRFRTLALGGYFDTVDKWAGYNTVDGTIEHGFDILGANPHFYQSRINGQSKFTKINMTVSRIQSIYKRLSGYVSLQGQYSFNQLLATEQYGFGGPLYGRGYGPSEIVGDRGAAGKFELRFDTIPEYKFLQTVQYYGFYDMGAIWNINHTTQPGKLSATSIGAGLRVNFMPQVSGEAYIAKPLNYYAFTLTPTDQNPQQARVFFQITARV